MFFWNFLALIQVYRHLMKMKLLSLSWEFLDDSPSFLTVLNKYHIILYHFVYGNKRSKYNDCLESSTFRDLCHRQSATYILSYNEPARAQVTFRKKILSLRSLPVDSHVTPIRKSYFDIEIVVKLYQLACHCLCLANSWIRSNIFIFML